MGYNKIRLEYSVDSGGPTKYEFKCAPALVKWLMKSDAEDREYTAAPFDLILVSNSDDPKQGRCYAVAAGAGPRDEQPCR